MGAAGAGDGAFGKGFAGCSAPLSPPTAEYAPNPPGVGIFQTVCARLLNSPAVGKDAPKRSPR